MPNCPKCSHEIKDDFGLVDCPSCGMSILIGLDGEIQEEAVDTAEVKEEVTSFEQDNESFQEEVTSFGNTGEDHQEEVTSFGEIESHSQEEVTSFSQHESSDEVVNDQFSAIGTSLNTSASPSGDVGDFVDEFTSFEAHVDDLVEDEFQTSQHQDVGTQANDIGGFTSQMEQEEQSEVTSFQSDQFAKVVAQDDISITNEALTSIETKTNSKPPEIFRNEPTNMIAIAELKKAKSNKVETGLADLSEFANSKKSSVNDGVLKYNIYIAGIDSHDIKDKVFEELADKKLLIDIKKLKSEVKNGEVCIRSVSAVKASVIINRLCYLPISILWDQYDIRKA